LAAASLTKETSCVLEVDRDDSPPGDDVGGWTASAMRAAIDGESHVPLRTFTYGKGNAARAVRVAQDVVYWLTLLDGGADGLLPRRSSSGETTMASAATMAMVNCRPGSAFVTASSTRTSA
jgi:hypothetical protein